MRSRIRNEHSWRRSVEFSTLESMELFLNPSFKIVGISVISSPAGLILVVTFNVADERATRTSETRYKFQFRRCFISSTLMRCPYYYYPYSNMSDSIILLYYRQRRPSSILHRDPSIAARFACRPARFKRMKKHPHPFLPFVLMNFGNDRDIFPFQPRRGYFPSFSHRGFSSCARNIYGSVGAERFAARTLLPAFVCPSVCPPIHASIHPSIHLSIRPLTAKLGSYEQSGLDYVNLRVTVPEFLTQLRPDFSPEILARVARSCQGRTGIRAGGWNRAESGSGPSLFGLFPVCSRSPSLRFCLPACLSLSLSLSLSRSSSYRRLCTYPFSLFHPGSPAMAFPDSFDDAVAMHNDASTKLCRRMSRRGSIQRVPRAFLRKKVPG